MPINKYAVKEKISRKKVVSALEKSKNNYGKLKASLDALEKQAEKVNAALEQTRASCSSARKEMMKYHKTIQNMDLSNASDVTFYDSGDVGYLISGTECHLDMDDTGDLRVVPMREHRRSKKSKDKNEAPYLSESDDASDEDGGDVNDARGFEDSFTEDMSSMNDELDNLYASLLRTASDHELDSEDDWSEDESDEGEWSKYESLEEDRSLAKLLDWAEEASSEEIQEKIDSLLEEMSLVNDTSKIKEKIYALKQVLSERGDDDSFAMDGETYFDDVLEEMEEDEEEDFDTDFQSGDLDEENDFEDPYLSGEDGFEDPFLDEDDEFGEFEDESDEFEDESDEFEGDEDEEEGEELDAMYKSKLQDKEDYDYPGSKYE